MDDEELLMDDDTKGFIVVVVAVAAAFIIFFGGLIYGVIRSDALQHERAVVCIQSGDSVVEHGGCRRAP